MFSRILVKCPNSVIRKDGLYLSLQQTSPNLVKRKPFMLIILITSRSQQKQQKCGDRQLVITCHNVSLRSHDVSVNAAREDKCWCEASFECLMTGVGGGCTVPHINTRRCSWQIPDQDTTALREHQVRHISYYYWNIVIFLNQCVKQHLFYIRVISLRWENKASRALYVVCK